MNNEAERVLDTLAKYRRLLELLFAIAIVCAVAYGDYSDIKLSDLTVRQSIEIMTLMFWAFSMISRKEP